ncbi:hypothetical protein V8E53_007699 [Lactarius tabidus]
MVKPSSIRRRNGVLPLPNARRQVFPAPAEPQSLVSQPRPRYRYTPALAAVIQRARNLVSLVKLQHYDPIAVTTACAPCGTACMDQQLAIEELWTACTQRRRRGTLDAAPPAWHLRATAHEAVGRFRKEVDAGFVSLSIRQAHRSRCLLTNFQTACKVRRLVSAKGRALVVGCRDEDAVGNSLIVLIPCLKPSKDADPFDDLGHATLTAL